MAFPLIGFLQFLIFRPPPAAIFSLAFVTFAFYGAAANVAGSHGFTDRPVGGAECRKTGGPMQQQAIGPACDTMALENLNRLE
jgi:hypothetical protein